MVHTPASQSPSDRHTLKSGQRSHPVSSPPQSTSVSLPLRTPSSQVGAWQTPSEHTPVAQSEPAAQTPPTAQPPQGPPQSTSVSPPFTRPSVQEGAMQRP